MNIQGQRGVYGNYVLWYVNSCSQKSSARFNSLRESGMEGTGTEGFGIKGTVSTEEEHLAGSAWGFLVFLRDLATMVRMDDLILFSLNRKLKPL